MRALGVVFVAVALVNCVHSQSTPTVHVMRSGALYPPLPPGCPLTFITNQFGDIYSAGYESLGTVAFAGTPEQMDRAASRIPDAVVHAACKMGGTAVSLFAAGGTERSGFVQFSIWRAPPSKPEPTSTSTSQQI